MGLPGEIARLPKENILSAIRIERSPMRGRSIEHVDNIRDSRLTHPIWRLYEPVKA